MPKPSVDKLRKQRASLREADLLSRQMEEKGMTSIPGFMKNMAMSPLESARQLGEYTWKSNPTLGGKAMAVGLPAAFAAQSISGKSEENVPGVSDDLARAPGVLAANLPFLAPMAAVPSMALSGALTSGAGAFTKRLMGRPKHSPAPPEPEDASASEGTERVYSNAAMGKPPEDMLT
jgi:hypothetical protein